MYSLRLKIVLALFDLGERNMAFSLFATVLTSADSCSCTTTAVNLVADLGIGPAVGSAGPWHP